MVGVVVESRGRAVCDCGRDCGGRRAGPNDETPSQRPELSVERVEVGKQLIPSNWSGCVHQALFEDKESNDLLVRGGGGRPRGVVVEAKIAPEPHHPPCPADVMLHGWAPVCS